MSRLSVLGAAALLLTVTPVQAQTAPPLTTEQLIESAVLPLPDELRPTATVLGFGSPGTMATLRKGTGSMICLADDPASAGFHVACYHQSMEPFMARGRQLRAEGVRGAQVDTVRYAEVDAGKLLMPKNPASLYSISGDGYDVATKEITAGRRLYVVYIPFATPESTGLPGVPVVGAPWIMFPGTPKAHIMFIPGM